MMQLSNLRAWTKALGALSAGLVLLLGLIVAGAAVAEPRVALVIGNSAYKGDLPALPNPANDAKLMARTLKSVGFDVVEAEDASQDEMKQAIAAFSDKLSAAGKNGTGLFFYAGHGLQVAGENYLIPIGAKIKKEADVDLVAVAASTVLRQMDFAGSAVNIIILDACRNNPLGGGARGMSRGLAEIKSTPRGSFIAYSTAPGSTAADGDGVNSPYTKALAETIIEPGLSISDVFQEVRTKVLAATGNQQTPWDSSSLTGRFYFTAPETTQTAAAAAPDAFAFEKTYWESVKDSTDTADYELYLKKYPNGVYKDVAEFKIQQLKGGAEAASVTEPQPAAPAPAKSDAAKIARPAGVSFIAQNQTVYAKGGGQVRADPDPGADLMAKLQINTEVTATGVSADGKWWRVAMADGRTGYMHRTVVSEQPVQLAAAPAQKQPQSQSPSQNPSQGQAEYAELRNAESGDSGRGLEMIGDSGAATAAPATGGADIQALGQVASAAQSGDLGQALSGLGTLLGGAQAPMGQPQAAVPRVDFLPINKTVTVRKGALIRGAPVYNAGAVARAGIDTKVQATGRTANNLWWEVLLPNGRTGYVEGRMIGR